MGSRFIFHSKHFHHYILRHPRPQHRCLVLLSHHHHPPPVRPQWQPVQCWVRALSSTPARPNKVEQSLQELKEKHGAVAAAPKRTIWKKVKDEIIHYYHGFRLLFIDIRVSTRLGYKVLKGDDLSRREHKQLVRTVSDVFRLLPFSVFIIVPFMEFLLPVALKLFPGMLPSTFETSSAAEAKFKKELKVKLEMAKFLQTTLDEMALTTRGEKHSHSAKEFAHFIETVRASGEQTTNEDIIKFCKLFEDEITLDNLTRPQLMALCRLLELQVFGTNQFLQFQLRTKLRHLKADDQMIMREGIESLSVPELQAACRARGMRAMGMPKERLQMQLNQWLELSMNEHVPQSLLLLSRALYLPDTLPASKQLQATIGSLSDKALTEAKFKIGEMEGKVDNKTKIELIREEEAAIKKEEEEEEAMLKAKLKDKELFKEELELPKAPEFVADKEFASQTETRPSAEAPAAAAGKEAPEMPAAKKPEDLSKEDIESLESAIKDVSEKKLLIEKEVLEDLKEEMAEYKEDIEELKEVVQVSKDTPKMKETKAAKRLSSRVNRMIGQMDKLIDNLGKEKQTLMEQISKEEEPTIKEKDDIISITDLMGAIKRIQKMPDNTKLEKIADVLDRMDVDNDGAVEVEHVLKVIEMLGRDNVSVTSKQIAEILEMIQKEEFLKKTTEEEKKL